MITLNTSTYCGLNLFSCVVLARSCKANYVFLVTYSLGSLLHNHNLSNYKMIAMVSHSKFTILKFTITYYLGIFKQAKIIYSLHLETINFLRNF